MELDGQRTDAVSLKGKRICVIEHDEGVRLALQTIFKTEGAEVTPYAAYDPEKIKGNFDLIILGDVERLTMGKLVDVCKEIKYPTHASHSTPVMVVSSLGNNKEKDVQELEKAGAQAVFLKPFENQEVIEAAKEILTPHSRIDKPIVVLEPAVHQERSSVNASISH